MGAVVGTAPRRAEGEGASLSMTMTAVMTAKTTTERRVRGQHEQVARRRQEIGRHTVPEQGLGHRVLGTMSIADLGVGRARGSSRAASGSPPGSGQAGYSSHSMPVTGLPGNLVPAWVLVGNVHVGVQGAGVRACDAALGVSSGGRGHGQAAGIAGSMIVGDPDRGEGAIVSTRRHGYRLSVIGYRLSVIG